MINELESKIRELLMDSLGEDLDLSNIGLEDSFFEQGVNSVNFVKLAVAIEAEFDFEFDDDDLNIANFENLKSLISYVENKVSYQSE